jgi:hypothetical protein
LAQIAQSSSLSLSSDM